LARIRRNRNKDAQDGKDMGDLPLRLRERREFSSEKIENPLQSS
jgi:hypothetical protein